MDRRVALFAAIVLSGCGYVGPVLPPSAQVPADITGLTAAERGANLVISFTAPAETTDNVPITSFSAVEIRVNDKVYQVAAPEVDDTQSRALQISDKIAASDWVGKTVEISARTSGKSGRFSPWSQPVSLQVVAPLSPPDVSIQPTKDGYALSWNSVADGAEYHVYRLGPGDKSPIEAGTTKDLHFTDSTAQWETPYTYTVTAELNGASSLPSEAHQVNAADTFPPSVPTALTAIAAPDSIELAWQRSPETDTAGYNVFRNGQKLASVPTPAYSDHAVEHGRTYTYSVSAVDRKGNESAQSEKVQIEFH